MVEEDLVFVMLAGLPCSGKSSLRPEFNELYGGVIASSDDYIERECANDGISYGDGFSKYARGGKRWLQRRVEFAIEHNQNILWDQTNLTAKIRASKLKQIPSYYKKICWYTKLETPEVLMQRQRLYRPNKIIPENVIETMYSNWESPSLNEGFDEVVLKTSMGEDAKEEGMNV